jgi:hypothetical protein
MAIPPPLDPSLGAERIEYPEGVREFKEEGSVSEESQVSERASISRF